MGINPLGGRGWYVSVPRDEDREIFNQAKLSAIKPPTMQERIQATEKTRLSQFPSGVEFKLTAHLVLERRKEYGVTLGFSFFKELTFDRNFPIPIRMVFGLLTIVTGVLNAPDALIKAGFGVDSKVRWLNPLRYLGAVLGFLAANASTISARANNEAAIRREVEGEDGKKGLKEDLSKRVLIVRDKLFEPVLTFKGSQKEKEVLLNKMHSLIKSSIAMEPAVKNRGWFKDWQAEVAILEKATTFGQDE